MNVRHIKVQLCVCILVTVASFIMVPEIEAQFRRPQSITRMDYGKAGPAAAFRTSEMQFLLEVHIDEVRTIADLGDKQVNQLKLTAKVVARKVFEEREKVFVMPKGDKLSRNRDGSSFSDQDAEFNANGEAVKPLQELMGFVRLTVALKHKTWTAAVKSILTDEQQTRVAEYNANRDKEIRKIAVQYRTWGLATRLRLHDDQIEQVAEVVDRIEGDKLVAAMDKFLQEEDAPVYRPERVTPDDFEGILTEVQMELFRAQRGEKTKSHSVEDSISRAPVVKKQISERGLQLDANADRPTVKTVEPGSSFEKMGLKIGDIIIKVDGVSVHPQVQINRVLQAKNEFVLTVIRDGKAVQLESKE